ncbi:hypothetical protein BABINDRAFT_163369 [Babjeviella inositovora NRRL Y-12698]|uniref:guanosine-diphosphatase n=1 Tax=Babjeviella inositovora NRRL Y-12698 TaxID=984486 RepID=A0A1E3QJM0_9ASCO|nr:uncharacterized protein BABINDRAFT_163369 [Babjeviella inositovora NRRL Y-12698]ODQ77654.1 hypothetical protein BABINDRAFT_163369 [Babjeviella inositovora NRRL Y-12698]
MIFSPRKARFTIATVILFALFIFFFSKIGNSGEDISKATTAKAFQNVGGPPPPSPPPAAKQPDIKEPNVPVPPPKEDAVIDPKFVDTEKAADAIKKPIAEAEAAKKPVTDAKKPVADAKKAADPDACSESEFVVMIDAGSTGSRVHVYEFNTCVSPPKLLREEFKMMNPGLSSFDTDATGAAASLDPLLEIALHTVPVSKHSCTPIAVKATAGLRLLGDAKSSKILAAVRKHLEDDYPFAVVEGDGISIMEGSNEGVYAWITANYLLGNIGGKGKSATAAVFDLGGGSTQIVFQPQFPVNEKMVDGEHKFDISFGGTDFNLYQFSHLGYGLMQGRDKINSLLINDNLASNAELAASKVDQGADIKTIKGAVTLNNPCIPPGVTAENVKVTMPNKDVYVVNFQGPATAAGSQCSKLAESILNKDSACTVQPCSFNGAHQPSLTKTFQATSDMYVFSYFYDRTNSFLPSSFTLKDLQDLTETICSGDASKMSSFTHDAIKELQDEPQWCLDLTFMVSLLHTGYDIPLERELKTAKKIADNELGWCLGASLPLLDKKAGGWTCRVTEVTE